MKNYNKIMRNIEQLGERYCRKNLDPWDKGKLQKDWWEALKFFFNLSFMRGRRDELSEQYCKFTIESLDKYFSITNGNPNSSYERLKGQREYFDKETILKFRTDKNIRNSLHKKCKDDFRKEVAEKNPIIDLLTTEKKVEVKGENKTYPKLVYLGNDEDIMMVLDVLKFISDGRQNIYNYLRNTISNSNSGVKDVHDELAGINGLTGMRAIGDKISALIIRDVVLMNPEIKIAKEYYKFAFPVDTWVTQIAIIMDPKNKKEDKEGTEKHIKRIQNYFIQKCEKPVDPLKFAAGLWYLGSHSLDMLIKNCLGKIEIRSITSPNGG